MLGVDIQLFGGRGASSGISEAGKPYGSEYRSLLTVGNIKFVKYKGGSATAPLETMTKGRVYVTINIDNEPKYISYYDRTNKRYKTIDLDKPHKGLSPHVHHGHEHNENDGPKGATRLSIKERKMVDIVRKLWYNRKGE